jgi:hypothetical protein
VTKTGAAVLFLIIGLVLAADWQSQAQGPLCIFTVDPRILYFEGDGGTDEVTVTPSAPGCTFEPRTAYPWIKPSVSEQFGKKVIKIEVAPTSNLAQRVGAVMVGTTQIEIVQKARDPQISW